MPNGAAYVDPLGLIGAGRSWVLTGLLMIILAIPERLSCSGTRARFNGVFCRYSLRTTDLDSARDFYLRAIGLALPQGASTTSSLEAWPLHERARARGAPAHWLGHIAVNDLSATLEQMKELGSEPLGPTVSAKDGVQFATLRDPFGAVLAVRMGQEPESNRPVAWHQLHTLDVDGACAMYKKLFGWSHRQTIDGSVPGGHRLFSWQEPGEAVGSMANSALLPGVHTHWLFHFPVEDLASCLTRVVALGGTAMGPFPLTDSLTFSVCEDPQGAAFGLVQSV
jgi:predicted enzyme related to lactoylglutathione lyase